jgi:hypothetical protein
MNHEEHKAEFMAAMRSVPAHHLVKALNTFTRGSTGLGAASRTWPTSTHA